MGDYQRFDLKADLRRQAFGLRQLGVGHDQGKAAGAAGEGLRAGIARGFQDGRSDCIETVVAGSDAAESLVGTVVVDLDQEQRKGLMRWILRSACAAQYRFEIFVTANAG